ncbi:BRO-N domain-containing protein [Sulfurimonas indica]|uniref:BRO-N domain-containing protein n=1 Tax=Sulfurimonas TaxID=202746 RepID=UPI00126313B2|nr:Bro-N domain-containing protein [Sulfurimonas indica]
MIPQIFKNENAEIRVLGDSGNPLFVVKDICDALGYSDVSMTLSKLDDDEKLTQRIFSSGQNRDMSVVTESGLYSLILRSNKPEAKKFKKWVTGEVLPTIRKQGTYSVSSETKKIEIVEDHIFKAIERLQEIVVSNIFDQKMAIDCLSSSVEQLVKQTEGLIGFQANIKSLPKFDNYIESNERLFSEIENVKRLLCYENPTLYRKDVDMYTEDIELFLSIYALLSNKDNKQITVNETIYYYFNMEDVIKEVSNDSIVLIKQKIENLFKHELFEKLVLENTSFDYVALTEKALRIITENTTQEQ